MFSICLIFGPYGNYELISKSNGRRFILNCTVRSTLVVVLTLFIPLWALAKSVLFI